MLLGLLKHKLDSIQLQKLITSLVNTGQSSPVKRLLPEPRSKGIVKSFDETSIYWELHGPETHKTPYPPLVFCYGLVCSMNQWRLQVQHFSQKHPCLLVDYRGHHISHMPQDPDSINISALAKDVSAAIKEQNFEERVHLFGHSMGCNVALELAFAEPDMINTLNLCCGSAQNPLQKLLNLGPINLGLQAILNKYQDQAEIYEKVWGVMIKQRFVVEKLATLFGFNPKTSSKKDIQTYAHAVSQINPRVFFRLLNDLSRSTTQAILPKIKTPTLVIAGQKDIITPISSQKDLARQLPNSLYHEIPLGSHNAQLDFPDYVSTLAENFWQKHGSSAKI